MQLSDYDRVPICPPPYPGVPRDLAQDAALHTPALMDPQEVQPALAYYRGQEMLIHWGSVTGHVAWDLIDPSTILGAAAYRQAALGYHYYEDSVYARQDSPDNIAARVAAESWLVRLFEPTQGGY